MTGTGNAASFAYTNSVIEYSSSSDMAAVNTLKQELTNVTDLQDASLTPGTVELILGSDFTGLKQPGQAPPRRRPQPIRLDHPHRVTQPQRLRHRHRHLAQSNDGITAAASCSADSSAFTGLC